MLRPSKYLLLLLALGCKELPETADRLTPKKNHGSQKTPQTTVDDSDEGDGAHSGTPADKHDIDYDAMTPVEALDKKYKLMQPFARGKQELEILRLSYETLVWGRKQNLWHDVTLEDLMAHARQESAQVIDMLEQGKDIKSAKAIGTNLWDFRMVPENDINGYISYSVWQTVEVHYLVLGRKFSPNIEQLYQDVIVKYSEANPWEYKAKIIAKEGEAQAKVIINKFLEDLTTVVSRNPELHVKIVADLMAGHYKEIGVRAPDAIRSYFWIDIQKNLNPANWLNPVIVAADRYADPSAGVRGDYGKQIALGNSYNDRGMVFWYGVNGDAKALGRMVDAWKNDPARLKKADYELLKEKNYLTYESKNPETYQYILSKLP